MAVAEESPSRTPAIKRWGIAGAASVCICLPWFTYLNRDGCWLYWRGTRGVIVFASLYLWLFLLFGFKKTGRAVLTGVTLVGLFFYPPGHAHEVAAAESITASTLRQLHSDLESYKAKHQGQTYPRTLPNIETSRVIPSTYRFEYVPSVAENGTIGSYIVKATPLRRWCGCTRSFTLMDDGKLYSTREDRPATISDELLQ